MRLSSLSNRELVHRCTRYEDPELWEEFISRTRRVIGTAVIRVARAVGESRPEILEELVQDTYVHLFADNRRVLRDFKPDDDDAVFSYLKVIAANLARDRFRADYADKRGRKVTDSDTQHESAPPVEVAVNAAREIERRTLTAEIQRCLEEVVSGNDAQRQKIIFWMYYEQGFSAREIADIPDFGLTTKGVESILHRLARAVREKLHSMQGRTGRTAGLFEGN